MSIKKSNVTVSLIIIVASVGALFGLSYQAPTTAVLTETELQTTILTNTEYPTYTQYTIVRASSVSYVTYVLYYLEKICAEWDSHQECSVNASPAAYATAETICMAVSMEALTGGYSGPCNIVDEGRVSAVYTSSALATLTYSPTESVYQVSTTILFATLTTNLFSTFTTSLPASFGLNQTPFTYMALVVIIGAIAVAIVIAYPKKQS